MNSYYTVTYIHIECCIITCIFPGEIPLKSAPAIRSRSISVCHAINRYGNKFHKEQDFAFNINTFLAFVEAFHKNVQVKLHFETAGHKFYFFLHTHPNSIPSKTCSQNGSTTSTARYLTATTTYWN